MRQAVEEHLACGCRTCEGDLRWLQHMFGSARLIRSAEPPPELVARAKALYHPARTRLAPQRGWWSLFRLPRPAIAAIALTLALLGATAVLIITPGTFAGAARLSGVEGIAERRMVAGNWTLVEPGAELRSGDSVRVSGGTAVVILFDGSTAELQSGAQLTLSTLRSGLFTFAVQVALSQQEGQVAYDVTALRGPASSFEVRSPAALVAVRGTRFALTVQNTEETKVEVFEGRVEVTNELARQILTQSQVAVVPVSAPLIHLPSLTPAPKPTGTPTQMAEPSPSNTSLSPTAPPTTKPHAAPVAATQTTALVEGPRATPSPKPTDTPTPAATADTDSTPTSTGTAVATATSESSPTPLPHREEFEGIIDRLPASRLGVWVIGGRSVLVKAGTEIVGRPAVGLWAKVQGLKHVSRPLEAVRIAIEEPRPSRTPAPWSTEPLPTPTVPEKPEPTATSQPAKTPWSALTTPTRAPRPTWTPRPGRTPPRTPAVAITIGPTAALAHTPTRTATAVPQGSDSVGRAR